MLRSRPVEMRDVSTCCRDVCGPSRSLTLRTAISKSTILSVNVDTVLSKQNLYSPTSFAVNTKSPCRSFSPSSIMRSFPGSFAGP